MISFIIPVYNKGSILFKTLSSLIKHLQQAHLHEYEIIIVNDGSTDNSFAEAIRFKQLNTTAHNIRIYHYRQNIGKGFALRFGFYKSSGETIVFLDGDMDIDTNQVMYAIKQFKNKNPDMVIGSKYVKFSRTSYPIRRFLYSLILKYCIHILFNLSVSDTQVGVKVFKREVLEKVLPRLIIKRFAADLELLVVSAMYGYTHVLEVPVIINLHETSRSSVNLSAAKDFCQDIAAIWYRKYILRYYDAHKPVLEFSTSLSFQTA